MAIAYLRGRLRNHFLKFFFLLLVFCAGSFYVHRTIDMDRNIQIVIMERSIRSAMNHDECLMPDLPVDNPEIMKYYEKVDKINCGKPTDDWVMCEKSICFVKPEVIALHGDINCVYTDIIRKTDFKARYGAQSLKRSEPYVLRESDFVKVFCVAVDGVRWYGMAFGLRDGVEKTLIHKPVPPPLDNLNPIKALEATNDLPSYFNVLMFGFDSLSRNAFIRKLPKTYKHLTKTLGTIVLTGYNIIGDGTTQALVPILTGYNELELPETRKRKWDAVPVDDAYPLIWKDFEHEGYITSFNEDLPDVGTFTYRMTGFQTQPVHHYLRTYYVEAENILPFNGRFCTGHTPGHIVMLDYTKHFMAKYSDTPRFVFSFNGVLSHDSINMIEAADDDVVAWLKDLQHKKLLENTLLIFMADHGNRFAEIRATIQGKQEERLPFFSFTIPESFKKRFPQEYANFVQNRNRLTTPYDVHATLKHILDLQKTPSTKNNLTYGTENIQTPNIVGANNINISNMAKKRAISLFDRIPNNRSCADAYIEPHWCACLNWQQLNVTANNGLLLKAADSIVKTINNATKRFRQFCEPLQFKHINWAMRLTPHSALVAFEKSRDVDGYSPKLDDSTRKTEQIYQLQILVSPGNSLFEASVYHNMQTQQMDTKLSEISRVNKYGSQANCIYERDPELRKYCYCKH